MARFMVKVLLLMCTLLFGMLLGIQQAEHGIHSILGLPVAGEQGEQGSAGKDADSETGTSDQNQPEIYIKRIDGEEVEVGYVGHPFSVNQLEEKAEQWEGHQTHNRYSQLGNALGDAVYSLSQKGAQWFASQLSKVF